MNIFKLVGSIFVDTDKADKNLKTTQDKADKTGRSFADMAKKAGKMAVGVGTAAAAVVSGAVKMASKTAAAVDQIDKMSTRLGLSRKAYQELSYVMSQAGVDINSMQTGMKSLLKNMDGVTEGNETAIANFEKLGVAVTDASGKMRNQEEVLYDVITAFQNMENGSEKSRLAQELLGKQGQELLPLLTAEAGSFEELSQKANDLGLVLDDSTINASVELHDTFDTVQRTLESMAAKIGARVMPMVQALLEWVMDHMPEIQEFFNKAGEVIGVAFDGIVYAWENFLQPAFEELWTYVSETVWPTLRDVFQKYILPTVDSVFKGCRRLWLTVLKPVLEAIAPIAELAKDGIMAAFEFIAENIGPVIDTIIGILKPVADTITAISEGLKWINDKAGDLTRSGKDWLNDPNNTAANNAKDMARNLGIPGLASGGGVYSGGLTWVGEHGPELLNLPAGSRVTNAGDSSEIVELLRQILLKDTTIQLDGREMGRMVRTYA